MFGSGTWSALDASLNRLKRHVEESRCVSPNANAAIIEEIAINAPAERLFEALTNRERRLKRWRGRRAVPGTHMAI